MEFNAAEPISSAVLTGTYVEFGTSVATAGKGEEFAVKLQCVQGRYSELSLKFHSFSKVQGWVTVHP